MPAHGEALTAERITIGGSPGRLALRFASGGPAAPPDGAPGAFGGPVSAVSGSTYTTPGPDGTTLTIKVSSSTMYVNADGSSAAAAAVKVGTIIRAEGTLPNQGKTLAAERITVGAPEGPSCVTAGGTFTVQGESSDLPGFFVGVEPAQ